MLLNRRDRDNGAAAECPPVPTPELIRPVVPGQRHVYAPPPGRRIVGLIGTGVIYALVMAGFFFTVTAVPAPPEAMPALTVMDLAPLSSPPEMPPEEIEAPKPVEKKEKPSEAPIVLPVERARIPIAPISPPAAIVTPQPDDPRPVDPETAAPRTTSAPLALQVSSNAADTWEGRVLAALHIERRYPRLAMARRQQGVPYIRFVMDRDGKVLSSRLERSSGFGELDREAVALAKRAAPLPKPPGDVAGETIEFVVPVEFFLSTR